MTIKIEIEVPSDLVLKGAGSDYLDRAAGALGWSRAATSYSHKEVGFKDGEFYSTEQVRAADEVKPFVAGATDNGQPVEQVAEPEQTEQTATQIDTRPVGSPAEGNKRRNSAEKAEDDEFEKLAVDKGVALDKLNNAIAQVGRAEAKRQLATLDVADKQVETQAAISTGEERIGPEDVQDAADEAAETEKSGLAPIDVLRRLLGDYQKKHGMPAAVKLCQEGGLIGKPIHELDDAGIEAAIVRMQAKPVEMEPQPKPDEEKLAPKTKADLVDAMMRYGDKYDGTREQAKMTHTLADMPVLFADLFGPEVTKLSQVPEDGYARAVAAVEAAIENDPYGRAK